jgi:hypothetical protein
MAVGIFESSRSFIGSFFLLLRLRGGCGFLDPFGDFPSATNDVRPTQGGAVGLRRHGLEVEDEGLLKNLVVIFVFLDALYCLLFVLMPVSYLKKKTENSSG